MFHVKHTSKIKIFGVATVLFLLSTITASLTFAQTAPPQTAPWSPWNKPERLLPYVRDAVLAQDPVDLSLSYAGASVAYGIVAGKETMDWTHSSYLKLGDAAPPDTNSASGIYDEFGTLHAVWSARTPEGVGLFYNRVLKGGNNVGVPRNLTIEGLNATSGDSNLGPIITYSRQEKKLFLVYVERTENGWPVWFTESGNQGSTWSTPQKIGIVSGSAPPLPNMITGLDGIPHVIYGVMTEGNNEITHLYHTYRNNGSWTNPVEISDGTRTRIFTPKMSLAPNGDIWVDWTAGQIDIARWDASTKKWQMWNSVSGKGGYTGWPTLAVGSSGTVWAIWINRTGDDAREWRLEFTQSFDNGQHWKPAQVGFVFSDKTVAKDSAWTGVGCLNALYAKGLIYLAMCVAPDDPRGVEWGSLFLSTVPENWDAPGTGTPTSSPSSSPTTSLAVSPTPSTSPALGSTPDSFEPNNTLAQALATGKLLVASGDPQIHNLFDPTNTDRQRDVDVIPFEAKAGKYYSVVATAVNNQNFQLKVSMYQLGSGVKGNSLLPENINLPRNISADNANWLGTATECEGDKHRICYGFKAEISGIYYAQFTNFLEGNGSPKDVYSVKLLEGDNPPATITPTVTATNTTSTPAVTTISPMPTSTLIPANTTTAVVTPTQPITTATIKSSISTTTAISTTQKSAPNNSGSNSGTGNSGNNNAGSQPQQPAKPNPTTTLSEAQVQATVYAEAQAAAAQTPLWLNMPVVTGKGGQGPRIAPDNYTPVKPTPKVIPTQTASSRPQTTTRGQGSTNPYGAVSPTPTSNTVVTAKKGEKLPTTPPPTGDLWMLPVGLLLLGKGGLNFWGGKYYGRK